MISARTKIGLAAVATATAAAAALIVTPGTSVGAPRGAVANVADATGASVGTVRFIPTEDGKLAVRATLRGVAAGFHGFHVHATGTCDPAAKDTTGATVPFFSAGGHFNPVTTNTHGAHAGDMPALLAGRDGAARMRFVTDRLSLAELFDGDGSAVIVHAGPDNLANVPGTTATGAERYHSHVDNAPGPDAATRATGDAGARWACGVIVRAS